MLSLSKHERRSPTKGTIRLVAALAVLLFASQCATAEEDFLPLGPMPEPKVVESHCGSRALNPDAVRHEQSPSATGLPPGTASR